MARREPRPPTRQRLLPEVSFQVGRVEAAAEAGLALRVTDQHAGGPQAVEGLRRGAWPFLDDLAHHAAQIGVTPERDDETSQVVAEDTVAVAGPRLQVRDP